MLREWGGWRNVRPQLHPTLATTIDPTGTSSTTESEGMTTDIPESTTESTEPEEPCVTPKPELVCWEYSRNAVECKKRDCEFKITNRNCLPPPPSCGNRKGLTTCTRGNSYYSVDGVNCKSHEGADQGDCKVLSVVMAANLFGQPHVDSNGILHEGEKTSHYTDDDLTRKPVNLNLKSYCKDGISGIPNQDKQLYSTVIVGDTGRRARGRCIHYHTNISKDGSYEFNVRTLEYYWGEQRHNGTNPRQFNIRLNGMVIWPELNILYKVPACQGLNLLTEFQLKNGVLKPSGLPEFQTTNGQVEVEFCYGNGERSDIHDTNYLVSSFYIVEIMSSDKPATTTSTIKTTEEMETELTSIAPLESTTWPGPVLPPGEKNCSILRNAVECKTAGDAECEYNLYNGSCRITRESKTPVPSGITACRRGNAWYVISGLLYKSHQGKDQGNCKVKHIAIGVNLNGPSHTDSRKIHHVADMTFLYTDKNNTRQPIHVATWNRSQCKDGVQDIPEQDRPLFSSLIFGRNEKRSKGSCISYWTKLVKDGSYELNIRTVETFWSEGIGNVLNPRYFNIKLNGRRILAEFNILRKVRACQGIDIFVEFEVSKGRLTPAGLTSSRIAKDRRVTLDFCYGDGVPGKRYDPNYIVSSFYIVGLYPAENPMTPPPTLPPTTTEYMLTTITTESSTGPGETTTEPPKTCTNDTGCLRRKSIYSVGGVPCISPYDQDQCNHTTISVVIAVNLNGPQHTDSRGITHVAEMSNQYSDEFNTRHPIHVANWKHSQCKDGITSLHPTDRTLFDSLIVGRSEARDYWTCISYHTSITKNGRYEFNVRTAETFWSDKIGNGAKPRHFNILLNGVTIWAEFNILHYANACEGVELFVEFEVTDGILTAAGFQSSMLGAHGQFEVEFCYGNGDVNDLYDPNYIVSSFYIIDLPAPDKPMPTISPTISTTSTRPTTTRRRTTTKKTKKTTTTARTTTTSKSILSTTIKPVTPGPTPTIEPPTCDGLNKDWDLNFCGCINSHSGCGVYFQALATTGKFICRDRTEYCHQFAPHHQRILFPGNSCRRARGTYSYGGLTCNNVRGDDENILTEDIGDCAINRTILAVRFSGKEDYTDVRNITYKSVSKVPPKNKNEYKLVPITLGADSKDLTLCQGPETIKKTYKNKDHALWNSYASGSNESVGSCFNYTFPKPEDGTYELIIKTTEYEFDEEGSTAFNVYLNEIGVFREVESNRFWKGACFASELISVFEITTDTANVTSITPRGFPSKSILNKMIEVAFCRGTCTNWANSIEFTGAAFSILKLSTNINDLDN